MSSDTELAIEHAALLRVARGLDVHQQRALREALAVDGGGWRVPARDPGYRGLVGLGLALAGRVPGTLGRLTRKGEQLRALLRLRSS